MKYQIKIEENEGKLQPADSGPVARDAPKSVLLQPRIDIGDAGYWERRVTELIVDCDLNEHAVTQVAEMGTSHLIHIANRIRTNSMSKDNE